MWLILKTIFVFIISLFVWAGISGITEGFFGLADAMQDIGDLFLVIHILLPPLIISIFYFRRGRERKVKDEPSTEPKTLSEKYDVLKIYKSLAILFMIIASGSYIYSLTNPYGFPEELAIEINIIATISYIITMFSLYCLTKLIDFLFDLDNK